MKTSVPKSEENDGNGNVVSWVNATSGDLAAVYEYDPYGNLLRNEVIDSAIADAPFRFSTKYTDVETGWACYGYRYYSAPLGRFVNKDPIAEQGGLNLYGFVGNNGINRWDYLGMGFWDWFSSSEDDDSVEYIYSSSPMPTTRRESDSAGFNGQDANGNGGRAVVLPTFVVPGSPQESGYNYVTSYNAQQAATQGGSQQSAVNGAGSAGGSGGGGGQSRKTTTATTDDTDSVYFDPVRGRGAEVIAANSGKKMGDMQIGSVADARAVLYNLGKATGNADVFRAKMAIYALNDPEGYRRNALRLSVLSLGMGMLQSLSLPGFRSGVAGGFTAEVTVTTNQGRLTTVLGSMADVGPYSVHDGFNTLVVGNWKYLSSDAVDAINRTWLQAAINRGDDIWLMTDPAVHSQLMLDLGKQSRYLDLELPMLQQSGVPATIKY